MGSVHSFFRPARQANGDWSQQELAEFYRVEAALTQSGLRVTSDRGLSDEDDPWFVFCRYDGDVILHFARIDGDYFIVSDAFERPMRGSDFRALLNMVASDHPTLMPIPRANSGGKSGSNIVLHPAALLAALVATVAFQLAGGDAMAGELATEGGAPAPDSSSADAFNGDLVTGLQGTHHATAGQTDGYGESGTSARETEDSTRNAQHALILSAMALASVALPTEHSVRVPVLDLAESTPGASTHTAGSVQSIEVGLPGDTGHPRHLDGQRLRTGASDVNAAAQALAPAASAPAEPTLPGANSASVGLTRVGMDGLNLAAVETLSLGSRGAQEVVAIHPTEIALTAIAALGSQVAPRAGSVAAASERTAPASGGSDSAAIGRGSTAPVTGAPAATSAAASPAAVTSSAAAGSEVGPVSSPVQATPAPTPSPSAVLAASAIGAFASPGSATQPSPPTGSALAVSGTEIETAHAVRSSSTQLPASSTLMPLSSDLGVHAASIAQPTPVGSGSTLVTGGVADHAAFTPISSVTAITGTAGSIPVLDQPTASVSGSAIKTALIGSATVDHPATTVAAVAAGTADHPAINATTSSTSTPAAIAAVDHPTTTATAAAAGTADHPATSATTISTSTPAAIAAVDHPVTTATAAATVDHPATSATTSSTGTPTAIAAVDHPTTTATAAATVDHPATSATTSSTGTPTAIAAVDHPTTTATAAATVDHSASSATSGGAGTPTGTGTAAVDHPAMTAAAAVNHPTTTATAATDHPASSAAASGTGSATQSAVATNSAVAITNAPALDDQARQLIGRFLETTSVRTVVTDHSFVLIDTNASHQASSDFGSRTWSIGPDLEIRLMGLSTDLHLAHV